MTTSKHLREDTDSADPYIFNNAEYEERRRVDQQSHALNTLLHDAPIHAPVSNLRGILEIGHGTGLMTTLLGRKFPQAKVYGIDPSLTPIGFHAKPDNVEYIQGRYEDLLESKDVRLQLASFDYIFVRMAVCWVVDWSSHIRRLMSLLKPGGWMELQDVSLATHFSNESVDPVDQDWLWARVVRDVCLASINASAGLHLQERMIEASLRDVKSICYPFCINQPLPDRPETEPIARYTKEFVPGVVFGLLDQYARERYSKREIQEMKDSSMETAFSDGLSRPVYWKFHVCIGKKAE